MMLFQKVDFYMGVNIRILLIVTIVVNWTDITHIFVTCSRVSMVVSTNSKFN